MIDVKICRKVSSVNLNFRDGYKDSRLRVEEPTVASTTLAVRCERANFLR